MGAKTMKRLAIPGLLAACVVVASGRGSGGDKKEDSKEAELTDLWLYKDATSKENAKAKGKMFQPFDLLPKERADNGDVTVSHEIPADALDKDAKGTVCLISFRLAAGQWAAARFTPGGEPAGRNPGIDVRRALFLDSKKPIFLVVRARTSTKAKAVVTLRCGGVSGTYSDGTSENPWEFPKSLRVTLSDQWSEQVIDLKGLHLELAHCVCPLSVSVTGDENEGTTRVYIDEVRFTTKR